MSIRSLSSVTIACVLGVGLGACSSSDGSGDTVLIAAGGASGAAAVPGAGGSVGSGGSASVTSGGTMGVAGAPVVAGSSGGAPGPSSSSGGATGSGGADGASGSGGGAGMGGDSGSGGAGGGGPAFGDCQDGSVGPCGTFTTLEGTKIQLGPYGAMMDVNVGKGFEVPINAADQPGSATCNSFAAAFGEDPAKTKILLDISKLNMALYTVYRPAKVVPGEKYPILTWGNGTCAKPEGYGALLRFIASQGYYVFAANSRWTGTNGPMLKALDFAFAANGDSSNTAYYQLLDTTNVGAMGHSQGSGATVDVAKDARVKAAILFNGGTAATKPFFAVSGDYDIGNPTVATYRNGMNGAPKAAFMFFHKVPQTGSVSGHLTLMLQPDRVVDAAAGFWDLVFRNDPKARDLFVGDNCGLCNKTADFDFGSKGF